MAPVQRCLAYLSLNPFQRRTRILTQSPRGSVPRIASPLSPRGRPSNLFPAHHAPNHICPMVPPALAGLSCPHCNRTVTYPTPHPSFRSRSHLSFPTIVLASPRPTLFSSLLGAAPISLSTSSLRLRYLVPNAVVLQPSPRAATCPRAGSIADPSALSGGPSEASAFLSGLSLVHPLPAHLHSPLLCFSFIPSSTPAQPSSALVVPHLRSPVSTPTRPSSAWSFPWAHCLPVTAACRRLPFDVPSPPLVPLVRPRKLLPHMLQAAACLLS